MSFAYRFLLKPKFYKYILLLKYLYHTKRSVLRVVVLMPVYKPPIDTVEQMLETDMDLAVAAETAASTLLRLDPRPKIQKLYNRQILYPFLHGHTPDWVWRG